MSVLPLQLMLLVLLLLVLSNRLPARSACSGCSVVANAAVCIPGLHTCVHYLVTSASQSHALPPLVPSREHSSDAYFAAQPAGLWHAYVHNSEWSAGALGHDGIKLTKQDQFLIKPTADGPVRVLLAAGIGADRPWPPGAGGARGIVALAVTPNDTGTQCRVWKTCPSDAKALAAAGETPFFIPGATHDGNVASVGFYARAGVTYGILPLPNEWSGAPQYRLAVYAMAPLEPIGPAAGVMQVLAPVM